MIEKIRDLIEDKVKEKGIIIDSITYEKEGNNYFLKIIIDKKNDIVNIGECVDVTKIVNPILDEADIIKDSYILDISGKEKDGE